MTAGLSQIAALVVYSPPRARLSQLAAMVPYQFSARATLASAMAALVPYSTEAKAADLSQMAALVPYASLPSNTPKVSAEAAMVVWGVTPPGAENRTRAWTFVMDGHRFYVLDLGLEGTYVFDVSTGQWAQFRTQGYTGWNMRAGTVWQVANRIVAGDTLHGIVWEMSPDDLLDEEFRTVEHLVTGGLMTRSRVYYSVEAVRLSGSIGAVQDGEDGITTELRFSDDNGNTWSDTYTTVVVEGEFDGEIAYRSLGSFMAPGRIFEFRDIGGMFRIDGADAYINDFDDDGNA